MPRAILLLGPTGAGKTPLGELLERQGLGGNKCFHFDFGAQLRRYAAAPTGLLSGTEMEIIRTSLRTGALLTDGEFPIAEKLLGAFIEDKGISGGVLTVMNGLPRHAGQAAALAKTVNMTAIVVLECAPGTVIERIRTDAGGDRGGRRDDSIEEVTKKLAIFAEKTLPLVKYYEGRGVPVIHIGVEACSSANDSRDELSRQLPRVLS
nr:nucleoside monophosphate kinase [Dehalogenimonas formicexedens]